MSVDVLHTYDNGGKKREVPLLSYQDWCENLSGAKAALAKRVVAMKRERPIHP